jgi:membrane protein implicated in regulation of membrane protease activity
MLITGLAFVFIKLGMMSVWVAVLSGGLQLAMLVIAGLFISIIWQKAFSKKEKSNITSKN